MKKNDLQNLRIARTAHNVVRAFKISEAGEKEGDLKTWEELTLVQKDVSAKAVNLIRTAERSHPSMFHSMWIDEKIKDGWRFGTELSEEEKTDPSMIDYHSLPKLERAKDRLFHTVASIGICE